MEITTIGVDLAKKSLVMVAAGQSGKILVKKKMNSEQFFNYLLSLERSVVVVFEACGGSSYFARKVRELGFRVMLVNPLKVARLRLTQKNDFNDCVAIIELAQREGTRTIAVNEIWQQDIQSVHRIRSRIVKSRVELQNQVHGLCLEYGVVLPEGTKFKIKFYEAIESADNELTADSIAS